jgi:hypothetical protein
VFSTLIRRRARFIVTPLVIFLANLISCPATFENRPSIRSVNLTTFLSKQRLLLGTVRAHRIYLSLDDVASADYLADLANNKNVLVISGFINDDHSVVVAELGQAVLKKLEDASPVDYHAIHEQLSSKRHIPPGEVIISTLQVPSDKRKTFPVDEIYTVFFTKGSPVSPKELSVGLRTALDVASKRGMETLILPCLGITWEHSADFRALTFNEFFSTFFHSIDPAKQSPTVYLSLYKGWPSFELEKAIASLNSTWGKEAPDGGSIRTTLYDVKYGAMMLSWCLCLLVCSFRTSPSLKHFLIISFEYLTIARSLGGLVEFFTQGRPSLESNVDFIMWIVLAVRFPVIVRWHPKELFKHNP